jgi:hypothetical protein
MLRGSSFGSLSTTSPHAGSYAARPGASARRTACRAARHRLLRLAQACRRLLRLRRATGCLGTSRGSSHRSSSTTPPRAGSSSTTSPTPRVQVPRLVARLVARLVVDYFDYAVRPGASARRADRRRLLRLRHVSGCFGTSRSSSRGSSSTTSTTPRVRVPRHVTRRVAQAHRQLLLLHRASGCFSTSRGLSCGSSSTTSNTPRVRVPRLVTRLVTRLVAPLVVVTTCPG